MKHTRFIILTGLGGALAGVTTFFLTRLVFANLIIPIGAGGLAAIIIPIIVVMLFYERLARGDEED